MSRLEELIQQLPPRLNQEVEEYVQSLLHKGNSVKPLPARLEWRGALRDLRDQFTSVELQHIMRQFVAQ